MVAEYLGKKSSDWQTYRDYSVPLRQYRNFVVHDVALGSIIAHGGIRLVPKKEKVNRYKSLEAVFAAANDTEIQRDDFIQVEEQMVLDFASLQSILNSVWKRPLHDIETLQYEERNPVLMARYNLTIAD